jgi:predicted ATPase
MKPLAEMIVQAAERTQLWLVTHSERLAKAIEDTGAGAVRTVMKRNGATAIEGLTLLGTFRDDED